MGSFARYNGSYQIPEEQRALFAEQMRRVLDLGGMMDTRRLELFGQRLVLLRPIREMKEETIQCNDDDIWPFQAQKKGAIYFDYNYFEDECWGSGGFTPKEASLYSDKVGNGEFSDTITAAYMLYELYDPDYGCAEKDGIFVEPSRRIGWLNHILGTQFPLGKRGELWACMEHEACSECGRKPDIHMVAGLLAKGLALDAVDDTEFRDLVNVMSGTADLTEDSVKNGTYKADVLKCKQALMRFFEENSDSELLWKLLEKDYGQREREDTAELAAIAELTLWMPARVFGYLTAEIQKLDFWELWRDRHTKVYHDEHRKQYEPAELTERRKEKLREPVAPIRTSEYLGHEDEDRLYWWNGTDEMRIAEETDAWLKELAVRHRKIVEDQKAGKIPSSGLRAFVTLLGEINGYYWRIYPFESMFQEFAEHVTETEYAAAIELLRQVADAEENRKAGSVISQEPSRWKSRRLTENVGRMRVKRMYAVFANRQLRQKYFGF